MTTELNDDVREIMSNVYQEGFTNTEVSAIIHESIENIIGENSFSNEKAILWSSKVKDACIANLNKLSKPYKYALTCNIMQKTGAGVHSASSCYWDNTNDAVCSVHWENDSTHCIVTVFGFAL